MAAGAGASSVATRPPGGAGAVVVREPSPGENRGLRWKGTFFIASFTACQWMRPVTCWDIKGYRVSARASAALVSGRRTPVSSAQNGRWSPSMIPTPAWTFSPGSVKEKR